MPVVLVKAETLDEILADKVLAFPTSLLDNLGRAVTADSVKIRHRDIWDLAWLITRGAKLVPELVTSKIKDYGVINYSGLVEHAIRQLPDIIRSREFNAQMSRFIDSATLARTLLVESYLNYVDTSVRGLFVEMKAAL